MPISPKGGLGFGPLGGMPLGGGDYSLTELIQSPQSSVFRKAHIRRRLSTTGLYETDWQDISDLIKRWGTLETRLDDIRLNKFTHNGVNLVVNNDGGDFNVHTNLNSLWNGSYLPRARSLLRIQAGYTDEFGGEYPVDTDTTQGIFILSDEVSIKSNSNDVTLRGSSLRSVFDEVRARDVGGIGTTQTASDIIARIRDYTDGSGVAIFQQFISSGAWTIVTTTSNYALNTTTMEDLTVWDLMEKLAESETFVILINRTGGIEFRGRGARQATAQWTMTGLDFPRPDIVNIDEYKEATNKQYTFFRLKYLQPETSTSYVSAGTTTSVNATNPSWVSGQKVYEANNIFINNTATAQTLVDSMYTTFGTLTSEAVIKTVLLPTLEILDRVEVSFHSYDLAGSTIWDGFDWDNANWSVEGENFDWDNKAFALLSKSTNLDDFTCTFRMREL